MISFFRKLSIGGKIKDGILPAEVMGTAEDLSIANNRSSLILKTNTELKESVYGKWRSICVLYRARPLDIQCAMSERWCDIVNKNCFLSFI